MKFRQSQLDFPLTVSLGEKSPSCTLSRWNSSSGLRFIPSDDEGFTLQGDRQQLLYKGKRRSHRYKIHSDTTFEYDCILLREPESNVITLRIEGAEQYDFFRQPDYVPDDFLKGSFAVYKKDTLVGQGTGKLCHIHRPLIIDALGRKVWGDLAVVGNELRITIPEWWLSQAKYPVVVDPTIGTTTVGSQNRWRPAPGEPLETLFFEMSMPVNRFLVPETINGLCTAFFYINQHDGDNGGYPILYSDNANAPQTRRSSAENFINMRFGGGVNAGWRSGTFRGNNVSAGSNIWFGISTEYTWYPRFDVGARCYAMGWDGGDVIPNIYFVPSWLEFYDLKLSMYFTYTSSQNYVRTLTQGINISDTRAVKAEYKRSNTQTTQIKDNRINKADYFRKAIQKINVITEVKSLFTFFRLCLSKAGISTGFSRFPFFSRFNNDDVNTSVLQKNSRELKRNIFDKLYFTDIASRSRIFFRIITDSISGTDVKNYHVLFVRTLEDRQNVSDVFIQCREYIRWLYSEAGSMADTDRSGNFYRVEKDTVQAEGLALRHLLIFIKLVCTCFVRDFFIRRFLISREQIVLKSKVTRELSIESKIN